MWWCCGKQKKLSPGCKYQKHISKEDYNDDEDDKQLIVQKLKCQLCNKVGHKASECDKDPNIRTHHDSDNELIRVDTMLQKKKEYTDSFTVT